MKKESNPYQPVEKHGCRPKPTPAPPKRRGCVLDKPTPPPPYPEKKQDVSVNRVALESLLYGSESLTSLGFEMVGLANKICPEHYKEFSGLFQKYHNANCGPLHRYAKDLIAR